MSNTEHIYQEWIENLPIEQQLELVTKIMQRLTQLLKEKPSLDKPRHSIMELHGLGAKQWLGIDAQSYVDQLRNEWDHSNRGN